MAYKGESIQKSAAQNLGSTYLRDYTHANKIFAPNSYDLAPKFKFLFHTYFDVNPVAYNRGINTGDNFGVLVKSIRLPSFQIKTTELNQYNRKRIIQTKINYENINITFHDDNINTITKLWDAYYTYYYADETNFNDMLTTGSPNANQENYTVRNIYDGNIKQNNWGYVGETYRQNQKAKAPFFRNITVFGLNRHTFTSYTLINPLIVKFDHDTYNYSEGNGTMECKMDISYETVVYNEGKLDGQTPDAIIRGFGLDAYYDKELSPITPRGANGFIPTNQGYQPGRNGYQKSLNQSQVDIPIVSNLPNYDI